MAAQVVSHYRLLSPLGSGGMGVVYRAEDTTLGRTVALKFLTELRASDPQVSRRLREEARTASALNHPNICTIYEVGEASGKTFIAMEYVEGRPLAEMIRTGGLPTETILRFGRQIASALEHAHDRGVIHRDLKPLNIVVTPQGNAKILDFGLAQRGDPAEFDKKTLETAPLEAAAALSGTIPYMAPEQIEGGGATPRTDLWSLGIVLYEMAAGTRPFRGENIYRLCTSMLRDPPPPLPLHVPAGLQTVIRRCLEKEPERRYQRAGEVRAALEALGQGTEATTVTEPTPGRSVGRARWIRFLVPVAATLVLAAAVVTWQGWRARRAAGQGSVGMQSLAVLPLENLSGDPNQDYLADGMTDALITELSHIRKLRVISRTSVMQYKRMPKSLPDIARELHVDDVVEGSVVRASSHVKISAKLIRISNEKTLWADSYERDFTDVLALQSDVATAVARAIQVEIPGEEAAQLSSRRAVVPEAYESYLKGRYEAAKRTPEGFTAAVKYFQEAIARDPTYAAAYAGLADSLQFLSNYQLRPPAEAMPQAKAAALKALQLDENLAEAHASLATIRFYYLEWDGVEEEFQRAIALNPGYATAHHWYALYLAAVNRNEKALAEIRLAQEIDPRSLIINANVGWCCYLGGQYDRAIEAERETLKLDPSFAVARGYLGQAYLEKQMYNAAIEEFRKTVLLSPADFARKAELANAYARAGQRAQAEEIIHEFLNAPRGKYISPYDWAVVYVGLGDKERALAWLEKAFEERNGRMVNVTVHPQFASLRGDPRFQDLLRRMGLSAASAHPPGSKP